MKKSEARYFAIADCIKDGINSIKQIAEELGVSRTTIQMDIQYMRNDLAKYGLKEKKNSEEKKWQISKKFLTNYLNILEVMK